LHCFSSKQQQITNQHTLGTNNMSIEDRAKAFAKNIEGKVQETIGEVTGNPNDKAEGKAKQAEAQVRHTAENLKDEVKKTLE
jgi:uncharacterized protein YjbJ (UPF0337 family)